MSITENDFSGEKVKVSETGALRNSVGKLRFDLIPTSYDKGMAEVLTYGAIKYADRNWEKGFKWMDVVGCLKRHLSAWEDGEDLDSDKFDEDGNMIAKGSGLNHLKHVLCNVGMLVEFLETHPELDDRPKRKQTAAKAKVSIPYVSNCQSDQSF